MGPLLIPAISTALGLAGNIFAQGQSARANRTVDNFIQARENRLNKDFATDYYNDFLDSSTARSALSRLNNQFKEQADALRNRTASTGATAEAALAGKDQLQKRYGDAVNNLAGLATQYKDKLKARHDAQIANLDSLKLSSLQNKAEQFGKLGQNITNAGTGMLQAWAMGGFDNVGSLFPGKDNGKIPVFSGQVPMNTTINNE